MLEARSRSGTPVNQPSMRAFGPCTLLAIAAAGFLILHSGLLTPGRPVILPSRLEIAAGQPQTGKGVSVPGLLAQADRLQLTAAQRRRFHDLESERNTAVAPLLAHLQADQEQFAGFLRQARDHHGASINQIQTGAAPYIADSGQLSRVESWFTGRALEVLTPAQRTTALKLRAGQASGEKLHPGPLETILHRYH